MIEAEIKINLKVEKGYIRINRYDWEGAASSPYISLCCF